MKRLFCLVLFILALGIGLSANGTIRLPSPLFALNGPAENETTDSLVVLRPDSRDGADPGWQRRYYYGKPSWGIRGSGKPESAELWFESFPGPSGRYQVSLGAILEADGCAPFRVRVGKSNLFDGKLPYFGGKKNCEIRGGPQELPLGTHDIAHGERVSVWAESVYECGEKGAYGLWYELRFRRQ
jgi:hypothetical protein